MSWDSKQRILVTGGTGFIGAALVKALVKRSNPVRVLDNSFRGSGRRLGTTLDQVEFIEGDVRDRDTVFRACEGVDVIAHLAAINGTRHFYEIPEQVLEVGIKGTIHTLEAARQLGVKEYYFASSSEAYQTPPRVPTDESVPLCIPDPLNARYSYGGSKLVGELLAFNYGRGRMKTVVFRPHNIYGADMGNDHVIPAFALRLRELVGTGRGKQLEFPIQGSGEETRAFCYIDDFIDGLLLIMERGKDQSVYHIGTEDEVAIADLAARMARIAGVEIRIQTSESPKGGTPRRCPDVSKLRELGYQPRVSLDEGLGRIQRALA